MSKSDSIISIEKQIEEKTKALTKLKKDIPKIIILVIVFIFVFPYMPLKRGSLINQYGYVNALLFEVAVLVIMLPIAWMFTVRKMNEEIYQLEFDLDCQKRLEKVNEES